MPEDNFYKRDRIEILKSIAIIYAPIEPYFHTVKWEETDSGWLPAFSAPKDIIEGLNKALRERI